jgi:hypothetical protein
MEVHHHPDLHHEKKKFKEYLLEFVMIFLAVTLGFFAETIRENIAEGHRENDYIVGLINNVQTDVSELKGLIDRNDAELRGIDSLLAIPKENLRKVPGQDSFYYYALQYTFGTHIFQFNDLTLVQLRNAGGYRVIRTGSVADSIALYESKNNSIKIQERFYVDNGVQTWASFKQVFDGTLTKNFFELYNKTGKVPADFSVLISKDEDRMNVLRNNYWVFAGTIEDYNNKLKEQRQWLQQFVVFLKQEYGL